MKGEAFGRMKIGKSTPRQLSLLQKFLERYYGTNSYEITGQIQQLSNNPAEATSQLAGAQVVFSFVLHPAVIATLSTLKKMGKIEHYVAPKTQAVVTTTVSSLQEAEQLCAQHNADIVNTKVLEDNQVSVRCTKTVSLLVDPVVQVVASEEIQ